MNNEEIKTKILELAELYAQNLELEKKEKHYIPASGKKIGKEELCAMLEASLDMWLTAGRFNDRFEKDFAQKLNVRHALSVNSGSSANLLALSALTSYKLGERALKKGDEVIAVASGFPTTVNPIVQNGLVPVFVDCETATYNINPDHLEKSISEKTKAIFIAHTLGNMYDMDKIMALAQKYHLWVIEDSCDALGAKWDNKYAGTIGHIGTFSFYPAHHLTMGEGGAVVTNDTMLYKILLSFRDWGRDCWCKPGTDNSCKKRFSMQLGRLPFGYDHKYTYSHAGYNLKIVDWQAAIGVEQLKKLDNFLAIRRENALYLLELLSDLKDCLILPTWNEKCSPSWFGFLISVKENAPFSKQALVEYLEKHGVGTRQLFAGNILRQPVFTENEILLRIEDNAPLYSNALEEKDFALLPGTEFIMNNTFWVGVAQCNTKDDMEKIAKTMHDFVAEQK